MSKKHPSISLGEGLAIVANLGVVLGLIFVWVELRQSQTQLRADVELSLAASYQTVLGRASENEHLADLMFLAYQEPEALTQRQYIQLMSVHAEWMAIVYATYELWQSGAIAQETWELHSNYYLLLLQTEWIQGFWRGMHHDGMYPAEFMQSLESRMPTPAASVPQ